MCEEEVFHYLRHSPVFHFVFFRVVVVGGSEHYLKVLGETKKEVGWGMSML